MDEKDKKIQDLTREIERLKAGAEITIENLEDNIKELAVWVNEHSEEIHMKGVSVFLEIGDDEKVRYCGCSATAMNLIGIVGLISKRLDDAMGDYDERALS
jgi:hypothetical protein